MEERFENRDVLPKIKTCIKCYQIHGEENAQTDMSPGVSTNVTADNDELAPAASVPSQVEVEARVKVQKEALAEMSEKATAKEKADCSVDNEEECTSCGS